MQQIITDTVTLGPDKAFESAKESLTFHRILRPMPPEVLIASGLPVDDGAIRLRWDGLPEGVHARVRFEEFPQGSTITVDACGADGEPAAHVPPGWGHDARKVITAVQAACRVKDTATDRAAVIAIVVLVIAIAALVVLTPRAL
jgi:hypothetical protein